MTAKWNKLMVTTVRTAVHGAAKRRIAAIDHLGDVLDLCGTRMHGIEDFFVMITENVLEDIAHDAIVNDF